MAYLNATQGARRAGTAGAVGTADILNSTIVAVDIADGALTLAKLANIATDKLIGRDTAGTGVPEALAVSGGLEFSGAGGIQRSALTGDVTAAAGGVSTTIASNAVTTAKINDAAVTAAKLANGAGVAAMLTSGLGASAAYTKATNGIQTLLASDVAARVVLIIAVVTEIFANGDGGQPTFKIGETDTDDKYAATSVFTNAAGGAIKIFAGTLTANKALLVTAVAGTGTTETGAVSVTAFILPAAA